MEHPEVPYKQKNDEIQELWRLRETPVDALKQDELMIVDLEVSRSIRGGGTISIGLRLRLVRFQAGRAGDRSYGRGSIGDAEEIERAQMCDTRRRSPGPPV